VARSVIVLIEGFSAAEQHALASMFELSRERATVYVRWREGAARGPALMLVDGSSPTAVDGALTHLENRPDLLPIWVVSKPEDEARMPANVVDVIRRPIDWQRMLSAMDALFAAPESGVDLDLDDEDSFVTRPQVLESVERVLLVHEAQDVPLLVRAALSARGFCELDHVADLASAQAEIEAQPYAAVLIGAEHARPELWPLVARARNQMATVFLLARRPTLLFRLQAFMHNVSAVLTPPLNLGPVTSVLAQRRK
jgi:hypothetical protein